MNSSQTSEAPKIAITTVETSSLDADAKDAIAETYEIGFELEQLGDFVRSALVELHDIRTFDDLSAKATRLRCIATQGHVMLSELVRHAGRLEALAGVRNAGIDE